LADVSEDYNLPITQEELHFALQNSRNSSPRPDDIPTGFLKNLPEEGLSYLLGFYNFIWNSQCFPDKWREAETIAIPKPNKDHMFPANFRPISLTCTLCKLLVKMLSNRLRCILETNDLISPFQNGFRQVRSTLDHLTCLDTAICDALVAHQHLIAISLDLEKAYEMVNKRRVLHCLAQSNVHGNLLAFLSNFLQNRRLRVRIGATVSPPIYTIKGLPQGSVLSVI